MIPVKRIILFIAACIILAASMIGCVRLFDSQFIVTTHNEIIDNWILTSGYSFDQRIPADKHTDVSVALYNSGYLYQEDINKGIDKDVVDELAKRMNMRFEQQVMPRARIHSMLEEGSLPMTVSLIETPERAKYAYFIPYFTQKNFALVRSSLGIKTEEELLSKTELKVGIIRSYYYGEHYSRLIEILRENRMVVEAKDTERLYDMLKNEWVDVVFNIPSSYLYYFEALDINDMSVLDWAPEEAPLERCISISKQFFTEVDVKRFSDAIQGMKDDGTLHEIFRKYLPEDEAKRMCDF